jgi:hypothetical protein
MSLDKKPWRCLRSKFEQVKSLIRKTISAKKILADKAIFDFNDLLSLLIKKRIKIKKK